MTVFQKIKRKISRYFHNKRINKITIDLPIADLPKDLTDFTVVHLANLNFQEMTKDVTALIQQLEDINPNMIAITGNLIADERYNAQELIYFMQGLVNIAPTYVVCGYNEYHLPNVQTLRQDVQKTGAQFLMNQTVWHEVGRSGVLVMGIDDKTANQGHDSLYIRRIAVPSPYAFEVKMLLAYHSEWFMHVHPKLEYLPDVTFSSVGKEEHDKRVNIWSFLGLSKNIQEPYEQGVYDHPMVPDKLLVMTNGGVKTKRLRFRRQDKPQIIVAKCVNKK